MEKRTRVKVLCVDDEPNVLEGLGLHLRRRFDLSTATSGAAGLALLEEAGPFAVVVSDMRMPGMDGAAFLGGVRRRHPDTSRILLTGQADIESAIAAVNEGQLFRFLAKPCSSDVLLKAIEAGAEQNRLITSERVLLEQTLQGSVRALANVLAIAHPASFGRGTRTRQRVAEILERLGIEDRWEILVAASLSQIGCITLPPLTVEKVYHGEILTERERAMVDRLPLVAERLLAEIPRLEGVREILGYQDRRFSGVGAPIEDKRGEEIPLGARLLKILLDYDALEAQSLPPEVAFDTMRGRAGWYDPSLLELFAGWTGNGGKAAEILEVVLSGLRPGMILAEDICSRKGMLLIARGYEVDEGLLERIRNFASGQAIREPIRVTAAAPATVLAGV